MFQTLKFFVIYLNIPSYTNTSPTNHDGRTLHNFEQKVEKEILPFNEVIQFLEQPPTRIPAIVFLKHGIQLKSKLEMLARESINVECEVNQLRKEIGGLKAQKDKADMYQLILGLTSRVDTLEKLLAPGEELKGKRSERWMQIFSKHTPAVENVRRKVHAAGMTEISFAEQVERLIQERNNLAGHANVPLPRLVKEKTIEGALNIMEITEDIKAVETLKILIAPVKGLDLWPRKRRIN
ncbi:uncharacterized protein LOC135840779 [Planococcus citri]|uniref:uncharacterized protein LOC135840779 n=1 Tax=Planococcus citri TaxID=170843 RepID=UPI0031F73D4B